MFFKANKEIKTEDLKLSDYDKIWTKFCFLDETGSLGNRQEPYFTIGIIKITQPYYLHSKILYERTKRNFYDEIKFNKLSKNNVEFAKWAICSFFETRSVNFYSYSISKQSDYFVRNFDSDPWRAYEQITLKLLDHALGNQEIIILVADHITTPKDVKFEVNTKKKFNASKKRLALAGVCRFDSKTNDLLQLVDLLIGAITYDVKLSKKLVFGSKYKIEITDFLKNKLGVKTFIGGFKNHNFSIFVDKTDEIK